MSIATATAAVRARQAADAPAAAMTAAPPSQETVLGQLAAFIPADVIVLWSGVQALVVVAATPGTWVKVGLVVVGTVIALAALLVDFALGDNEAKEKDPNATPVSGDRKLKTAILVGLAFVLWNLCGPATPISGTAGVAILFAIALIFSFFATKLARLWGLAIPN